MTASVPSQQQQQHPSDVYASPVRKSPVTSPGSSRKYSVTSPNRAVSPTNEEIISPLKQQVEAVASELRQASLEALSRKSSLTGVNSSRRQGGEPTDPVSPKSPASRSPTRTPSPEQHKQRASIEIDIIQLKAKGEQGSLFADIAGVDLEPINDPSYQSTTEDSSSAVRSAQQLPRQGTYTIESAKSSRASSRKASGEIEPPTSPSQQLPSSNYNSRRSSRKSSVTSPKRTGHLSDEEVFFYRKMFIFNFRKQNLKTFRSVGDFSFTKFVKETLNCYPSELS